jgi:ribosomal protein S12 methylthiotransferase accessory factor
MMDIPAFKTHFHVEVIPGENVLLLSEDTVRALHGTAYEKVFPLIDGRRSIDEIVDALTHELDAAAAYYVLHELESKGYHNMANSTSPGPACGN